MRKTRIFIKKNKDIIYCIAIISIVIYLIFNKLLDKKDGYSHTNPVSKGGRIVEKITYNNNYSLQMDRSEPEEKQCIIPDIIQ